MKKFLARGGLFCLFFAAISVALYFFDQNVYDRVFNDHYLYAVNNEEVKKNVFIGSSKSEWALIDTVLENSTILAKVGQFSYASSTVILKLHEQGLLESNNIFIDLEESDEITKGFGKWWYFAESFITYRTAHFDDYPLEDQPTILARIYKDLTHFAPNHSRPFKWRALEDLKGYEESRANPDSLNFKKHNFNNCGIKFSRPYRKFLLRFQKYCEEIEAETNSKIFIILPPYPDAGCFKEYTAIFGNDRILDLTNLEYKISDFHDNSHMNSRGAIKFSKEISKKLDSINSL